MQVVGREQAGLVWLEAGPVPASTYSCVHCVAVRHSTTGASINRAKRSPRCCPERSGRDPPLALSLIRPPRSTLHAPDNTKYVGRAHTIIPSK